LTQAIKKGAANTFGCLFALIFGAAGLGVSILVVWFGLHFIFGAPSPLRYVTEDPGVKSCKMIANDSITVSTNAEIVRGLWDSRYPELRKFGDAINNANRDGLVHANNSEAAKAAISADIADLPHYIGACEAHGVTFNLDMPLVR